MSFGGKVKSGIARFGHHVGGAVQKLAGHGATIVHKFGEIAGKVAHAANSLDSILGGAISKNPIGAGVLAGVNAASGVSHMVGRVLDKAAGVGGTVKKLAMRAGG